jgi:hypothetical protein
MLMVEDLFYSTQGRRDSQAARYQASLAAVTGRKVDALVSRYLNNLDYAQAELNF